MNDVRTIIEQSDENISIPDFQPKRELLCKNWVNWNRKNWLYFQANSKF